MSDLRSHLLDLLTDAEHAPHCRGKTCICLIGTIRLVLEDKDPYRKAPAAELEPTFRRPQ